MEYMRGWRALFRDPEWGKKLGIGTVLILSTLCIPIIGQVVLAGYMALALRRAVQGQDSPLPRLDFDFDYLGKLVGVGFKPMIGQLVYSLAIIPIVMVLMVSFMIVPAVASQGGETGEIVGIVVAVVAMVLYVVSMFAFQVVIGVASLRASLMEDLGAALRPKAVLSMSRMMAKDILVGGFVHMLIFFPLLILGMLALYVGAFVVAMILMHVQTFYMAEVYKRYLEKGGEPLPIGPMDVEAK